MPAFLKDVFQSVKSAQDDMIDIYGLRLDTVYQLIRYAFVGSLQI